MQEKPNYGSFPVPTEWGISGKDYYMDAQRASQPHLALPKPSLVLQQACLLLVPTARPALLTPYAGRCCCCSCCGRQVVDHMKYATAMEKGTANMDLINKNMKKEMVGPAAPEAWRDRQCLTQAAPTAPGQVDFVSFYRRFNNVAGKQSFSTLYTAINVLAGECRCCC